ncbi:MAG: phage head closure protein [Anaerolineae bacterium]|nr:phage head closure protein [Anaerolineae bacterium]
MRAGKLRHRVVIQQNTPTRDTDGAELESWSTVATVWAAVIPLSGREQFINAEDQTVALSSTRIEMRYRSGLTTRMRVTWSGHTYDIQRIVEVNTRQRELHLLCEEVNADE